MTDYWSPTGAIAQLGERLLCKQEVVGSIPSGSTSLGAMRLGSAGQPDDAWSAKAVAPEPARVKADRLDYSADKT
jgi:hypothetical protein